MNRDHVIIAALIVIIVALVVGILTFTPDLTKEDSKIVIKADSPFYEGDSIRIKLTDLNGNPLPNQTVKITVTDKNNTSSTHSVVLDKKGKADFKINNSKGKYVIEAEYEGNDYFIGNSSVKKINIEQKVLSAQMTGSAHAEDPGAFYSYQDGRTIYTGEVHDAPDGHKWKHLGNNEWEKID